MYLPPWCLRGRGEGSGLFASIQDESYTKRMNDASL